MVRQIELKLLPKEADDKSVIYQHAARLCGIHLSEINEVVISRRSIDARGFQPYFRLKADVYIGEVFQPEPAILRGFSPVDNKKEILIIGAGPAGYFAALELIELGIKPVVLDRGKDVRSRRRDLRAIQQAGIVNPDSNYCFGEGGAGTYSDGKLYTRSHKRGSIQKVLKLLVEHGASTDILVDTHPHIGSNKLPKIVGNLRQTILNYGGEVHFDQRVTGFILDQNKVKGVITNDKEEHFGEGVILATGHSARDIYRLLNAKGIAIDSKMFALGVRVEHSQGLIDKIQYNQPIREENLPVSSYRLACQVKERGVFSFCMCPGGLVVPAATAPGEIVVNGMSMSRRDSPFANSGIVVAIEPKDLAPYDRHGIFAGLEFQKEVEQTMFNAGDGSQKAPAQRLTDFVKGKISADVNDTSYIPGLFSAPVHELLPKGISNRLKEAFLVFGKTMKGYYTEDANVIATESRTSAPIKIPRNADSLMHPGVAGLFPAGEGAGYAGGIISAAMDGQNVAKAVAKWLNNN